MNINLYNNPHIEVEIDIGDIIVYCNDYNDFDYYMLIRDCDSVYKLKLLDIKSNRVVKSCCNYAELIKHIQEPINNYALKEIIPSDKLELNRIY